MASTEQIDEILGEKNLRQFGELTGLVAKSVAEIERLIASGVELNRVFANAKTPAEFTEGTKRLAEVERQLSLATNQLADAEERVRQKRVSSTKSTVEQKVAQAELNKQLKDQAREALGLIGAYERLEREYKQAAKLAKDLAVQYGAQSKQAREAGKAAIELDARLKAADANVGKFNRNVGNYASAFGGLNTALGGFAATVASIFTVQKLTEFLGSAVEEFNEAQDVVSRLDNTLSTIGRNDALGRLQESASALMDEFKTVDDEEILGVFDQLITYGKLTEKQINQLLPVIINYSAKTKTSLADSTSAIIKGLNGNGKALKEFGVDVTGVKNVSEAFGIVMTQLAPKIDGAAKAFGETTRGQIEATRVEIGNLKEDIGGKLQPVIKGFYQFLSQALAGIPLIFEYIGRGIQTTVAVTTNAAKLVKAALTFDFDRIKEIKEEIRVGNERIKTEKEYQQIRAQAKSIASSAENLPEAQQNKLLKTNIALRDASIASYKTLFAAGKQFSTEGKAAAKQLLLDIETVNKLEETIARSKDTRILGTGGAKDDDTENKTARKNFDSEIKDQIEGYKKLSEITTLSLESRVAAAGRAAELERGIIQQNFNLELEQAQGNAIKIANANAEKNDKIATLERKLSADLIDIRQSSIAYQRQQDEKANEDTLKGIEDFYNKRIKKAQEQEAKDIAGISGRKDAEVEKLNVIYQAQLKAADNNQKKIEKITEEYNNKRLEIEYIYARAVLQVEIKSAEAQIAIRKALGQDVSAAQAAVTKAKLALSDLETNHIIANNKKEARSTTEKYAEITTAIEKIKNISSTLGDLVGGALDAQLIKQKNQIQDQSDAIDIRKEKEIQAIESSVLSEEEKANKINIINVRTQAQKDALEVKQRQLDQQRARFDKARAISEIVLNTALAVVKALASSPPPTNFINAALVGALGAAQLAVAIATPIPKYKYGTGDHPGGHAIVGDGGKSELVVMPGGRMMVTPDKPTVMNLPKHSIVLPDLQKALETGIMASWKGGSVEKNDNKELLEGIKKEMRLTRLAYKNRGTSRTTVSGRGISKAVQYGVNFIQYIEDNVNFK